jgi:hypothetical protein
VRIAQDQKNLCELRVSAVNPIIIFASFAIFASLRFIRRPSSGTHQETLRLVMACVIITFVPKIRE